MRANLIQYTWKGTSGYSYGYVMITDKVSVEDIVRDKRTKVLWGGAEDCWGSKCALEKCGIMIGAYASVFERWDVKATYSHIIGYRDLLKHADDYFFIVAEKDPYRLKEICKMIQHFGVDEFGILYEGFTKDFCGRKKLQDAFFATINEIFGETSLLNHWDTLENCRRSTLEGAGYWDVLYAQIYGLRKRYGPLKYFEVGPGIGTMSLALKKVMDLDVTWLCMPNEDGEMGAMWSEASSASAKALYDKYGIHIEEGYLELEKFEGSYDVIVLAQVMEHFIFNPVNAITKLRNMLSDQGYLFVSVPEDIKHYNVESFKEMPYPDELTAEERKRREQINEFYHFHEYSYEEATEIFKLSGLKEVYHTLSGTIHHFMLEKA